MTDLHALTASELADGYRRGSFSVPEALAACLAQVEAHNPALNAIIAIDADLARAQAEAAQTRWQTGTPLSPLDGVPATVKDNLVTKGFRATWGSRLYEHFIPDRDELAVARLRASGAIIIGKTNTPELALAGFTSNDLFGSTGNPWDPTKTPGGSSGGAVAAIMGGMAPIALATDAGGSIRRPASHTGCVGLKPSIGCTPRRGGFPALTSDFQTIGPLARSVDDLAITLDSLRGQTTMLIDGPLAGSTVAAVCSIGEAPIDPEVATRFAACVDLLRSFGADVREVACPFDPEEIGALFLDIAAAGVAAVLEVMAKDGSEAGQAIQMLGEKGRSLSAADYARQLNAATDFRWRMHDFFEGYDLLLTPTAAALPWDRDEPFPKTIAGQQAAPRASAIYTTFANVAGLPGLSFPFGLSEAGLPIGMQIVGQRGADDRLLSVGRQLEAEIKWPRLAPMAS